MATIQGNSSDKTFADDVLAVTDATGIVSSEITADKSSNENSASDSKASNDSLRESANASSFDTQARGLSSPAVQKIRKVRPMRFAAGMLLTAMGMLMILLIGVQVLHVQHYAGNFAMVLVGFCVLSGVMMLGGGFGLMATASAGFDEEEFDRLIRTGNIASADDFPSKNRAA